MVDSYVKVTRFYRSLATLILDSAITLDDNYSGDCTGLVDYHRVLFTGQRFSDLLGGTQLQVNVWWLTDGPLSLIEV